MRNSNSNSNSKTNFLEPVTLGLIPVNALIMRLPNGVLLGVPEEGEAFYILFEGLIPVSLYDHYGLSDFTETDNAT